MYGQWTHEHAHTTQLMHFMEHFEWLFWYSCLKIDWVLSQVIGHKNKINTQHTIHSFVFN